MTCYRFGAWIICTEPSIIKLRPTVWMQYHKYLGPRFFHDRHGMREIEDWWSRKDVVDAFNKWQQDGK